MSILRAVGIWLDFPIPIELAIRLHVGIAAPGRSQKVLLMRTYVALLAAAKKAFAEDGAPTTRT